MTTTATTTPRRTTTKAKVSPTGTDRIPRRSQGYYRDPDTGDRYRSVTNILSGGIPKEALPFWAGNLVAQCAIDHLPALVRASRDRSTRQQSYDWLRRAHTRAKDERADVGTAVHQLIEARILDQPVPQQLLDDPDMAPYLRHFQAFVDDYDVTFEASEMVVANPEHRYAGTLDYLVRAPAVVDHLAATMWLPPDADRDTPLMGDTKTGGDICQADDECVRQRPSQFRTCPGYPHPIKGVYPEAGLQMAAYRAASTCWLRDGTKTAMPPTHPVGVVLHLRPTGYLLVPARCGGEQFATFAHAMRIAEWTSDLSDHVLGRPVPPPARDPGRPTPTHADHDRGPGVTRPQLARIAAGIRAAGITERADALEYVSEVIGRPVTSRKDLTRAEAGRVIDHLEQPPDPTSPDRAQEAST